MFSSWRSQWVKRNPFKGTRSIQYVYFNGQKQRSSWSWSSLTQRQKKHVYVAGGVLSLFLIGHVEQAPVTKRYRLMLASNWIEEFVTNQSFQSVMSQYQGYILPSYHPLTRKVSSIMTRLIASAHDYVDPDTGERVNLFKVSGKEDIPLDKWEFYVIDDVAMRAPTPNAFVIGGGKVFLFRSLLPICANDDGLATVLSHELGHLLADHIGEKLSISPFFITLDLIMFSVFGSSRPGAFLNAMLNNSYSREMETEADYIGLMVQSKACFNPQKAPNLWKNMIKFEESNGSGGVPELLSTHPSSDRRFRNLETWMPKAVATYDNSGCNDNSYNNLMSSFFR